MTFGRRRRQRAIDQQLREIDRLEFGVSYKRPRRRPHVPSFRATPEIVALILIPIVVAALVATWLTSGNGPSDERPAKDVAGTRSTSPSSRRLLPMVVPAHASHDYTALYSDASLRWDPCLPIHYVVRHSGESSRFDVMLRAAVAEVSRDSGLKFVADGATAELPPYSLANRALRQPSLYGNGIAPVLIAWSNAGENPQLAGSTEGLAGPVPGRVGDGPVRFVSGAVTYNLDGLKLLAARPHGLRQVKVVLLHELGHLVGLGHVHDRTQIMNPRAGDFSPSDFGAGDLAGLAAMGSGSCSAA